MFDTQESTPWYRSLTSLVAASLLVPPVGLALLWVHRQIPTKTKLLASLGILLLGTGYFFGFKALRKSSANEAHYAALEQHRAQQQLEAQQQAAANPQAPAGAASPQTAAAGQPGVTPGQSSETASAHASRNYWTNFRGPNRDGRYDEMAVSTAWPAQGLPLLWKQPAGLGYSSFTIADGRAYTIEQRRRQEVVAAYDVNTGRELWIQGWNAEYTDDTGDGPRTTPTWDDGRLYALGATGELRCLDAKTGAVSWGKNILSDNQAQNLSWAMSASPLVVDDKVIVLPGGPGGKSVVAYNKLTGAAVWKSQDDRQAYVSPMLVTLAGRRQILVVSADRVFGLAPENGALLWSQSWDTSMGINVSQPIMVDKNRFFISSGYGKGASLVEVTGAGNSLTARSVWDNVNMKNKFNSSVLHDGYVYGLDEGILTCLDVSTGERKWKGGRYGYGQVLVASGHLIVMSDTGELALVKASPAQYTEVARFPALEGKTWNYPAIAGGRLFVRNANEMAAYKIAE
ncbi:MAG TPA: PQQ-binding-like beta-propeller repeat protein [Pyrinomonadaceae bacterium]|jgi:outer membrane protein assembly factor BamB|nr:PQQ-binding-like beta-propeller repeat protein [Pyrinomonadaceae bacterium]